MKKNNTIVWGIILVIIGIILGLNALGITNINLFFNGWWTLIIIFISINAIINKVEKTNSIIGLIIGILLFLICQDIISWALVSKLLLPIILIFIGGSIILNNTINNRLYKEIKKLNEEKNNQKEYYAIFSKQEIKLDKKFTSTCINAIFGFINLVITESIIKKQVLNCYSIFGGIDLIVPNNVKIKVRSISIFGGVNDLRKDINNKDDDKIVYINALCLFGGINIK